MIAIIAAQSNAAEWVRVLAQARGEGTLVCSDVVYAEVGIGFGHQAELDCVLAALGVHFDPVQSDAAWTAGQIFKQYRQQGGPRTNLIPDFLVAAHAQIQADRLASSDRGYLRRNFPNLVLIQP